jgi:phosphate starvation-inducible PhoH-like protein
LPRRREAPEKGAKKTRKRKTAKKESKPVRIQGARVNKVNPRTEQQDVYLEAIENSPMTFATGPAGTGKTFLACYVAAKKLVEGKVRRIVLCRPAVEAGEKLGFLPGRIEDKLDPYLRPLYDALNDLVGFDKTKELIQNRIIEIVPLAFMRGRTLNNAFVILDEAQNATITQMKMFLTRMGNNSVFVINGDTTQADLTNEQSGLIDAKKHLKQTEGVCWVKFTKDDVIRHWVVKNILEAYGDD